MVIIFRWWVWGAWSIFIHLLKGSRLALGWEDRHSALLQRTQRSQRKRRSWLWEIVSLTPQSHIFHGGYYCLKLQFGLLSYVTFVTTGVPLSYSLGCQHTTIRWELLPFVYAMLGCSWWFLSDAFGIYVKIKESRMRIQSDSGLIYTRAWGPMTIEIENLSMVESAGIIPLHFTVELEGLRNQGRLNGWKTYMETYLACNGW